MKPAVTAYRLLSFDLDGTLVDTAGEIAEAAQRALRDAGLPPPSVEAVTVRIGAGTRALVASLIDGSGRDVDRVLRSFMDHYTEVAGSTCAPYAGVVDALARLRSAGLQLACVTNKDSAFSQRVLAACGLEAAFDLLVGGDTLAFKKPDARVLGHVLQVLGADAVTMAHVGDSRTDVAAARNAGVAAWTVPYGYNGGEPVASANPDRMFDDLTGVADFVLSDR